MPEIPVSLCSKIAVFSMLALSACGEDTGEKSDTDAGVGTDGQIASDALQPKPDGAMAPDSGPAGKYKFDQVSCDEDKYSTCSEACQARGSSCAAECSIGAGKASYGYPTKYGWYKIVTSMNLADCNQTPEKSAMHDGKSYSLSTWLCCCKIPDVTKVGGDMNKLQSCDTTCAARGMLCDPKHNWGTTIPGQPNIGGIKLWYRRQSTGGSSTYVHSSCTHLPSLAKKISSNLYDLKSYTCACY